MAGTPDDVATWRADMLAAQLRTAQLLEALLQAAHGGLTALAEIKGAIVIETPGEEETSPPDVVTVAELLEQLGEDVAEAAMKAGLLEPGEADDGDDEPTT